MAARIERERVEGEAATVGLQYPRCYSEAVLFTTIIVAAGPVREAGGRPGALPTAEQEGRDFLLNSCLIRSIHLLSLYREVYLTPKQGLLDP